MRRGRVAVAARAAPAPAQRPAKTDADVGGFFGTPTIRVREPDFAGR